MRSDPLSPLRVLQALELFGAQARPYNFDDCFDCWGLVRRVFDHLDDGYEINERLGYAGDGREENWAPIADRGELVPGDLLTTHAHLDDAFHTVFYCGRVAGLDLVYDSSPRGLVPLFERQGGARRLVADRAIHTRYMRATEATDRLRHDGGAYLRLWDDRERFYDRAVHARLLAGGAGGGGAAKGRDLVALRLAAGLGKLPFYCVRQLPRDAAGREVYDNRLTRYLDAYIPDGPPVADDDYEAVMERGEAAPGAQRPPAPRLESAPLWVVDDGPVTVTWRYPEDGGHAAAAGEADRAAFVAGDASAPAPLVTGCRVEVWEETWDVWKNRLLRLDFDTPITTFTVPDDVLHSDGRFSLVVYATGPGGYSGTALAAFLYRPAPESPLLDYDPVRPEDLWPDAGASLAPGVPAELKWSIREPRRSQAAAVVEVYEDGCLTDGLEPVFTAELDGPAAAACRVVVPGDVLRPARTYSWYVTARTADGRTAFAPAEGVFTVSEGG